MRRGSTLGARARIASFGFHFPGKPIDLASLPLEKSERDRLPKLGQKLTYASQIDSTELMVAAARDALARSGVAAEDIATVISAPSLITSYGLEIPAVAIRAALGLKRAECLNIAQGCVGALRGIHLARQLLLAEPERGDILVVTSCRASQLTHNFNHGAFFWGDAGAAVLVTARPGPGLHVAAYAERSADSEWGAMRIPFGDLEPHALDNGQPSIGIHFSSPDAQFDYVRGEQERFSAVLRELIGRAAPEKPDLEALFLPSTGQNRVKSLFSDDKAFLQTLKTDFSYAHFGGVDPIFSLSTYLDQRPVDGEGLFAVLSPAFTAQWAGLLLDYRPA